MEPAGAAEYVTTVRGTLGALRLLSAPSTKRSDFARAPSDASCACSSGHSFGFASNERMHQDDGSPSGAMTACLPRRSSEVHAFG